MQHNPKNLESISPLNLKALNHPRNFNSQVRNIHYTQNSTLSNFMLYIHEAHSSFDHLIIHNKTVKEVKFYPFLKTIKVQIDKMQNLRVCSYRENDKSVMYKHKVCIYIV